MGNELGRMENLQSSRFVASCLIGGIVLGGSMLGYYLGLDFPPFNMRKKKKKIRVYMDGCFDMMHYGHCNALRQARALGDELIVGVVSDAEIIANKGPPVTPLHERMIMVNAVKWVDDVIPDAPYAITEEFMKKLFTEYNIDYIIHGDDPCLLPDGTDAYALARKAGRYKQIKRTEGVSSTDIVGRMLLCVRERSVGETRNRSSLQRQFSHGHSQKFEDGGSGTGTRVSHFLPTSRRIVQFSNGKGPGPDARIVYIDGAFDLFHAGHVEILKRARGLGDFLLVGIHTDLTVSDHRGAHRPIMNLHERSLSVLACRYVDEVIIGAPWGVSKDMITTFNISLVVHGTIAENKDVEKGECNPYAVPMSMGIYQLLESPLDITTSTIIKRIVSNHEAYQVLIYGEESDAQLSPAMSATIRVFKRMIGLPDSESNGEGNGAGSVSSVENCFIRLLVNKVQVSVGKEASHFSQIMKSAESAGAQVSFFSFQKLPVYATSDERIIFIKGSSSNVLKAFEKVVGHLSKFVVDLSFISLLKETGRAVPPDNDTVSIWSEISNSMHHTTQTVTGSDYPPSNEMLRFQLNCAIKPQMPQTNWLLYGHPALAGLHPSEIEYPSALKVTQGSATPASDHTVDTWSEISHSMHPTTPQTVIDSDYPPSKKQCLRLNSEMKQQMPHVAWSLDRHSALAERPSGIECSAAPIFTRTMQVPLSYAEEITRIAGENIRYIQRISVATLTEPKRSKDLLSKFTIVIRGTYPQVQTAQQLILEFMAGYKVPLASIYGFEPYGAGNEPRTTYRL